MKIKWRCKLCGSIQISDTKERHNMNMCLCGISGVDAESHYCRFQGEVELIKPDKETLIKYYEIKRKFE